MGTSIAKIRRGNQLATEIVQAAGMANDDKRTSRVELEGILANEGYGARHPMNKATMSLYRHAAGVARGAVPTEADIATAARRQVRAIERAAARDGDGNDLSRSEFQTLSPRLQRAVLFARKYGDSTLDAHFF